MRSWIIQTNRWCGAFSQVKLLFFNFQSLLSITSFPNPTGQNLNINCLQILSRRSTPSRTPQSSTPSCWLEAANIRTQTSNQPKSIDSTSTHLNSPWYQNCPMGSVLTVLSSFRKTISSLWLEVTRTTRLWREAVSGSILTKKKYTKFPAWTTLQPIWTASFGKIAGSTSSVGSVMLSETGTSLLTSKGKLSSYSGTPSLKTIGSWSTRPSPPTFPCLQKTKICGFPIIFRFLTRSSSYGCPKNSRIFIFGGYSIEGKFRNQGIVLKVESSGSEDSDDESPG